MQNNCVVQLEDDVFKSNDHLLTYVIFELNYIALLHYHVTQTSSHKFSSPTDQIFFCSMYRPFI